MVNYCIECGSKLAGENPKFCAECGAKVPAEINNKYDLFRNIKNKELYKIINNNGKVKIKKVE